MKNIEIERKWLVDGFFELEMEDESLQEQGYLAFMPTTVRIRKTECKDGVDYRLCCKGPGGLVRSEVEVALTEEKYAALYAMLPQPPVTKRHRTYRLQGGLLLECSRVDEGQPEEFFFAEVEFESEEAASAFVPPAFLRREVTDEAYYTMAAYCQRKYAQILNTKKPPSL